MPASLSFEPGSARPARENPKRRRKTMRHLGTTLGTLLVTMAIGSPAQAADAQKLHQENCVSCHTSMVGGDGSELYTRENRLVKSFDSLVTQVNRCNVNLGTGWFDEEVESVARYLSENYYKF
jgi:mono/diheme cytochrome c family protein